MENKNEMGIGDWGLGIAQSPIPNPQSPLFNIQLNKILLSYYNNFYY